MQKICWNAVKGVRSEKMKCFVCLPLSKFAQKYFIKKTVHELACGHSRLLCVYALNYSFLVLFLRRFEKKISRPFLSFDYSIQWQESKN